MNPQINPPQDSLSDVITSQSKPSTLSLIRKRMLDKTVASAILNDVELNTFPKIEKEEETKEISPDEEIISKSHVFFTEDILKQYSNHYLNNNSEKIVMLSTKDLMNRLPEETTFDKRVELMVSYVKNVCSGNALKTDVNIDEKIHRLLEEYYNQEIQYGVFDFVTFEKQDEDDNSLSFILIEKGACLKMSEMYVLSLFCSNQSIGNLAFQLYIFTILYKYVIRQQHDIVGLLDVAYGYTNISGFCLYSKYGFRENGDLFTKNEEYCFDDIMNLPMIFEPSKFIEKYKKEKNISNVINVEGIKNVIIYITNQEETTNCKITKYDITYKKIDLQNYYNILSNLYMILKTGLEKEFEYIYNVYNACTEYPVIISYHIIFDKFVTDILNGEEKDILSECDNECLDFIRSSFTNEQRVELFTNIKNIVYSKMTFIQNCIETNNIDCAKQTIEEYNKFINNSERCSV